MNRRSRFFRFRLMSGVGAAVAGIVFFAAPAQAGYASTSCSECYVVTPATNPASAGAGELGRLCLPGNEQRPAQGTAEPDVHRAHRFHPHSCHWPERDLYLGAARLLRHAELAERRSAEYLHRRREGAGPLRGSEFRGLGGVRRRQLGGRPMRSTGVPRRSPCRSPGSAAWLSAKRPRPRSTPTSSPGSTQPGPRSPCSWSTRTTTRSTRRTSPPTGHRSQSRFRPTPGAGR